LEPKRRLADWHHILAMVLVMVLIAVGLGYLFYHYDFIPFPSSLERGLIDNFMRVLFIIAGVFVAIVLTMLGYALIFFRRRKGDDTDAKPVRDNIPLEITWTVIPLIIVLVLSFYGAKVLDEMTAVNPVYSASQSIYSLGVFVPGMVPVTSNSTGNEIHIEVHARRFVWTFAYPDFGINSSYILEVPVNTRLVLNMNSQDVIHSFWVQQWGTKQDAVPGLSPVLRLTPTKIGQYLVQCSQLCGFGHTAMTAPVSVVSEADFASWVKQQQGSSGNVTPPTGAEVMIDLTAQNIAFSLSTITVPPGISVMVNFNNKDAGVPHNFAVYTTSAATDKIFIGQIITGPATTTYTFTAPSTPGNYFFRCDVHPTQMTGTLIVK